MAIRKILTWPDQRLREVAAPVTEWSEDVSTLIEDMFETMYDYQGVGLAATQIGIPLRIIVLDCGLEQREPIAMVNPVIETCEGETTFMEGCLSVPGLRAEIDRAETVTVTFQDANGIQQSLTTTSLLAICVQHEIDHLNGKLYFEHLPPFEQKAFLNAYADAQKETKV